jgi:type II secretory pathway component PulK
MSIPFLHNRHRRRRGYALLLVLFVLAIAAAAMAGIGRLSFEKSLRASRAESDLRRRWAVLTARSVLLPKADAILTRADAPVSQVRSTILLNGRPLTLIFGDEQAKANINLLYARLGLAGAEREVRAIVAGANAAVPVELRPVPGVGKSFGTPDADDEDPLAFESFGQMFGPSPPQALHPVAADLTCWGDGVLNLNRASDRAVRAALSGRLAAAEITRLLDFRAKNPDLDGSDLLDLLKLSERRREAVDDLLAGESSCHSLWTISDSGNRKWYDLAISQGDGEPVLFEW